MLGSGEHVAVKLLRVAGDKVKVLKAELQALRTLTDNPLLCRHATRLRAARVNRTTGLLEIAMELGAASLRDLLRAAEGGGGAGGSNREWLKEAAQFLRAARGGAGGAAASGAADPPLPPGSAAQRLHLAARVTECVAALHGGGWVLGDIKPSNIIFAPPFDEIEVPRGVGGGGGGGRGGGGGGGGGGGEGDGGGGSSTYATAACGGSNAAATTPSTSAAMPSDTPEDGVRVVLCDLAGASLEPYIPMLTPPPTTLPYQAPEQLRHYETPNNVRSSQAADVYALGLVLFELLTLRCPMKALRDQDAKVAGLGRPRFQGDKSSDPLHVRLTELVRKAAAETERGDDLPCFNESERDVYGAPLLGKVARCWAFKPEDRPRFIGPDDARPPDDLNLECLARALRDAANSKGGFGLPSLRGWPPVDNIVRLKQEVAALKAELLLRRAPSRAASAAQPAPLGLRAPPSPGAGGSTGGGSAGVEAAERVRAARSRAEMKRLALMDAELRETNAQQIAADLNVQVDAALAKHLADHDNIDAAAQHLKLKRSAKEAAAALATAKAHHELASELAELAEEFAAGEAQSLETPPQRPTYAAFLSHAQDTAGDEALQLREALTALDQKVWLDQDREPTPDDVRSDMAKSAALVLLLSDRTLARPAVRLEVSTALDMHKPIIFIVLEAGQAHGSTVTSAAHALLRQGRALQAADGRAGVDAAAAAPKRLHALSNEQWDALERRLEEAPTRRLEGVPTGAIGFYRNLKRLWSETVRPLAAALGIRAECRDAIPAAPATALFRMRRPRPAEGACDALIISAAAGANQAAFLQLALQQRCARRELVLEVAAAEVAAAETAVTGAASVLVLLTDRFFEEAPVAAALRAALRLMKPLVLVHEQDFRHGGLERLDFFINGCDEVRDAAGNVRMAAVKPTPDDLLPLYTGAVAQVFERRTEKREVMLKELLGKLGAVSAEAACRPPPLLSTFKEGPVRAYIDKIESLLLCGQRGKLGEEGVSNAAAAAAGGAAAAPLSPVPLMPCRVVATGGLGGAGKTTLATAIAHARDIRAAFDDIFWVTVGRATRMQLLAKMRELIVELADEDTGAHEESGQEATVEASTKRLRELLGKRRALVVVDDAWTQEHFAAFLGAVETPADPARSRAGSRAGTGSNADGAIAARSMSSMGIAPAPGGSALLFTTRNLDIFRRVAEPAASRALLAQLWARFGHCAALEAAELADEPALEFIAEAMGISLLRAQSLNFSRIFASVGKLPLALSVVGAWARAELEPLCYPDDGAEPAVVNDLSTILSGGGDWTGARSPARVVVRVSLMPAEWSWSAGTLAWRVPAAEAAPVPAVPSPRRTFADSTPLEHGKWHLNPRFMDALRSQNSEEESYRPTFRAISLCLGSLLSKSHALSFAALGLFRDGAAIDERIVEIAWRMKSAPRDASALLERLQAAGLVKIYIAAGGGGGGADRGGKEGGAGDARAVMLHDLAHDFAAALCDVQERGAAALHDNFLARLAQELPNSGTPASGGCRPWWSFRDTVFGPFAAEHLLFHLHAARLRYEAHALVFQLPWLQFVLRKRGALALIADIERYVTQSVDRDLLLETLRLSLPGLLEVNASWDEAADSLLPGQIVGRIGVELRERWPTTLGALSSECWKWRGPQPWIRLQLPSLTQPGGPLKSTLEGHTGLVNCLVALNDARCVSGSTDGTLMVWNAVTGVSEFVLQGHTSDVSCVALLRDWRVVSGSLDCTLRIWDTFSGACERVLEGHTRAVSCVAVLHDGRVVSGSDDTTLRVWDAASGTCEHVLEGHTGGVSCVSVIERDGVASGSKRDNVLRVWNTDSGEIQCALEEHTGNISCLAVLTDGRIVSGSRDGTLRIWDAAGRDLDIVHEGHSKGVLCVTVLADSRYVVSGSVDKTLRVGDKGQRRLHRSFGQAPCTCNVCVHIAERRASRERFRRSEVACLELGLEKRANA